MVSAKIQYLYDRGMFGIKLGLENIQNLLDHYNIDTEYLRTVHIAGTNGKGSTASIISAVLTDAGYKTGLFTSPHLQRFNERIKIGDKEIPDDELSEYIEVLKKGIEKFNCTFFEAGTAIAFKYFIDKKVDIAIIETGLGGRLDSTNVINPIVSVITGIDLDHQKQLGGSVVEIAREKAGIIKSGVPVVLNTKRKSAAGVITSVAKKKGSRLHIVKNSDRDFFENKNRLMIKYLFNNTSFISGINIRGDYQKNNIKTAIQTLKIISKDLPLDGRNIKNVLETISIKGRMQTVKKEPEIILDAAHNGEGLEHLKKEMTKFAGRKIYLLAGMVKDKDYERNLDIILSMNAQIYFVESSNKRMLELDTIKKYKPLKRRSDIHFIRSPKEALRNILSLYKQKDIIVGTGSHYVLGELMDEINNL